jgi:hypothetical protein
MPWIIMPFGKYRGRFLGDVPADYLDWILRECRTAQLWLRNAVREELESRARAAGYARECSNDGDAAESLEEGKIQSCWRGLVRDYHPDRGGSVEAMAALNEAHERLQKVLKS